LLAMSARQKVLTVHSQNNQVCEQKGLLVSVHLFLQKHRSLPSSGKGMLT